MTHGHLGYRPGGGALTWRSLREKIAFHADDVNDYLSLM
ncbi:hypothetical protein L837_4156 [Mycobacterium avium MAV_061107_1842]|nr:hypothetical protein L837_4156 [Mycobacterium avium MAV_061107_1842]